MISLEDINADVQFADTVPTSLSASSGFAWRGSRHSVMANEAASKEYDQNPDREAVDCVQSMCW